ncbi:unnamed protein product [Sphenostylis stenocarpa]|uniref:TF-B3 domain-containing protein n=1 Tax=Sphenostylis stenocarpa TaxID=92480 RepID=A0AA86SP21_9FABA|nr:unnamed protein product [Sphenostylis stenocarpa]
MERKMKVRSDREKTKVVIRHLPPSLTQSDLFQHIDSHFASRYNWFSFRPGNTSHKRQKHSRAYIDFNCPHDVFEFAEFFDGHVFVNERGAQHRAIVEYAPSQRAPKPSTKKDGREGTIYKDPDYLEFLKLIAKPHEHLPSAEIQLERKEAEQGDSEDKFQYHCSHAISSFPGANKETPIVTPLMEYVRQKRSVDTGMQVLQASSAVAKVSRRSRAALPGKPGSGTKRGSEKKKYVQKDNAKSAARRESKDKSAFIVVPQREDLSAESSMKGISEFEALHGIEGSISGIPLSSDSGKKKILLLKGKHREIPSATEGTGKQQNIQSGNSPISTSVKQNHRRETSGRLIRSILLNNEARQSQSMQHKIQILSSENGKRPSRSFGSRSGLNDQLSNHDAAQVNSEGDSKRALDEKFVRRDPHGLGSGEKTEKRTRNKDRPDRGVWTPLRRSDVSHAGNDHSSSSMAQPTLSNLESTEGELKENVTSGNRGSEFSASAGGRGNPSIENGSQRNFARRGASYVVKDDGAVSISEGKPSKKNVGHSAYEVYMSYADVFFIVCLADSSCVKFPYHHIMYTQSGYHSCNVELRSLLRTSSTTNSGQPDSKRLERCLPDGACTIKGMRSYRPLLGNVCVWDVTVKFLVHNMGRYAGKSEKSCPVQGTSKSLIPMQPRRRKDDGTSAERDSKHFLKIILPSAIHANQMSKSVKATLIGIARDLGSKLFFGASFLYLIARIPEEFIKRFGDELSTVATITVPDGRVWRMRLKKCGKDVFFRSKWREFVKYYSLGYGSHLIFRYVGNSKFRVLIFDITSAEICYPRKTRGNNEETNSENWKRSKFDDQHHSYQTKKKELKEENVVESSDEDEVNLIRLSKGRKKESDFSHGKQVKRGCSENHSPWEIAKFAATATTSATASDRLKPKNPFVTCVIKSDRLLAFLVQYVSSEFAGKYLKPCVGMMLQNSNGEAWDVSCVHHNGSRAMIICRGWTKFMRDNDLSVGDLCVLELIKRDPVVLKLTLRGEAQ